MCRKYEEEIAILSLNDIVLMISDIHGMFVVFFYGKVVNVVREVGYLL